MPSPSIFFQDFQPCSREEWIALIEQEIGPNRGFSSLRREIDPNLFVAPCYSREELAALEFNGSNATQKWKIAEETTTADSDGAVPSDQVELVLLDGDGTADWIDKTISLTEHGLQVFVRCEAAIFSDPEILFERLPASCSLLVNPFSENSHDDEGLFPFERVLTLLTDSAESGKGPGVGLINAPGLTQSGAGISTILAHLLNGVSEWCLRASEVGVSASRVAALVTIDAGHHGSFYDSIASLRALRTLLPQVVESYSPKDGRDSIPHIHVSVNGFNRSANSPLEALISSTTSAISAALGQPDSIRIAPPPFDEKMGGVDEARRLARNILLLLRHESFFSHVYDPLAGSYYIESLTNQLAGAAWDKFLKIERAGGFASEGRKKLFSKWLDEDRAMQNRNAMGDRPL